jgi:FMN phosphatase YigB (HAD superfamily)
MGLLEKYNIFLFDLDGTLLELDFQSFVAAYYDLLFKKASQFIDSQLFKKALRAGIEAMIVNDGRKTNKEAFYEAFESVAGPVDEGLQTFFNEFYLRDFKQLAQHGRARKEAIQLVKLVKERGKKIVLATNPVFPRVAVIERLTWAGLRPELFDLITSFEEMRACKPNPIYFRQIIEMLGADGQPAVMIGDDPELDVGAIKAGIDLILIDSPGMANYKLDGSVKKVKNLRELLDNL